MRIIPFNSSFLPATAELFAANLRELRERNPILPDDLTDPERVEELLADILTPENAVVALEGDRLAGYLGWWIVPGFRGMDRIGGYSPPYGHGADAGQAARVYRALYAAVAARWAQAGCQVHALTLLARQAEAERFFFQNGFGMLLHDAIRPMTPINVNPARGLRLRRAEMSDVPALAQLDVEHCLHYSQPPVFMVPRVPESPNALAKFLVEEPNSIWLAEAEGQPQAFLRFQRESDGAALIVRSPETIAITGAYTRPEWRGRGAAPALLDAALRDYAARGFTRMSVDYETINPDALAFWPRYFEPVAVSLTRVPEHLGLTVSR